MLNYIRQFDKPAQPVDDASNRRENIPSIYTPNDKKPATQQAERPVEHDVEGGNVPNDDTTCLADQQLRDWVTKLCEAPPNPFFWDRQHGEVATVSYNRWRRFAYKKGDNETADLATYQTMLRTEESSIAYLETLRAKLIKARENENVWLKQQSTSCEARAAALLKLQSQAERTMEAAKEVHDHCKKKIDQHQDKEIQEPAQKKRKIEIPENDGSISETLPAYSDDFVGKVFNHGEDVRILGKTMAGLDKNTKLVISMILGHWNKLRRKHWKSFDAYTAAMEALGARNDLLTGEQSASIWKSQMEARREMGCFETLRSMPVFTLEECCGEENESD